jgi:type I restriction enzyme S subunit
MSFPRYPKYTQSGVEWLGEVPEHWHVDRIKRSITSCQNGIWGNEAQQDENDIPCVRVADFDRQRLRVELLEPTIRNVTQKERAGRVLNRGDLLLEKSGGGEAQPVGCVVLYDDPSPAVCSNFVARLKVAADMNSSFWRYLHAAA